VEHVSQPTKRQLVREEENVRLTRFVIEVVSQPFLPLLAGRFGGLGWIQGSLARVVGVEVPLDADAQCLGELLPEVRTLPKRSDDGLMAWRRPPERHQE
jgi:hypothetical protein